LKIVGFSKPVFVYLIKGTRGLVPCFIFLICFLFLTGQCYAQEKAPASHLLEMKSVQDSLTRQNPAEKIYLQLDKSIYTPGDTLWFKAYLFNAPTLNLSAKSGIMYVSIVTDSNVVIKRQRLPVEKGLSWGNISLKELPAGTYTLIAYTQWLQNFNQDCFFRKQFTIADDAGSNWLANYTCSNIITDNKEQANVKLMLSDIYKTAVAGKSVQLSVLKGRRQLFRQTIQTDDKGLIDITFKLPAKSGGIRIIAADAGGNRVDIPLNFNRPQDADVQFMPEGGDLVAGLPAHIGFKAIGADGKGISVSGVVQNHEKQEVANFTSQHLGMGSFDLPVSNTGESYTAKVTMPGGTTREFPLPDVKSEGIVLNVANTAREDSIRVSLAATNKFAMPGQNYLLIGKSCGIVCYGAVVNFKSGASLTQKISKRLFPSGITHFILLDMKNRPLNERLTFINGHDNLHLTIDADKTTYAPHDSVALHINVIDALGNPVAGNFSLAVTDDAMVHQDSLNNENIITRMLLTSELKGYIEQPDYYLNINDTRSKAALDNLLLTQGWVSYEWPEEKSRPVYAAETEFSIRGRVLNAFNKPVKATKISLLSKAPLLVAEAVTDNTGHFMFNNLPIADTPAFVLKTVKNFNVGIVMDDAPVPIFTASAAEARMSWYVNSDTSLFNTVKNNRIRQNQLNDLPADAHALKEVRIIAKKVIKGSQNLNGPGEADMTFNEADMEKAGKETWLNILKEKVPGFRMGLISKPSEFNQIESYHYGAIVNSLMEKSKADVFAAAQNTPLPLIAAIPRNATWYFIDNKPIRLIVDGISFGSVFVNPYIDHRISFNDLKNYLETHDAEDIKGMEIISSGKYAGNYYARYIPMDWQSYISSDDFTFIELTTRSGQGPILRNTPGKYLYKPLALSLPARFYSPRYAIMDKAKHQADLRSTIYWEPNITTGADGKAVVRFYTADVSAIYSILINGTDMAGGFGYKQEKLKVSPPAP
jgi:hypothetical protein